MQLKVSIRKEGDVTVVSMTGRIVTGQEAYLFEDTMLGLSAEAFKNILLNLGDVEYVDSVSICKFVSVLDDLNLMGSALKLTNLKDTVLCAFSATKVAELFEIFEDEVTALHGFSKHQAQA